MVELWQNGEEKQQHSQIKRKRRVKTNAEENYVFLQNR